MNEHTQIGTIDAEGLAALLADDTISAQFIDVREREEVEIVALPQFWVLPLSESQTWIESVLTQLDRDRRTIVMCHHGLRSLHLCHWLKAQGFTAVYNLSGGIDAYAVRVDPSLPRY